MPLEATGEDASVSSVPLDLRSGVGPIKGTTLVPKVVEIRGAKPEPTFQGGSGLPLSAVRADARAAVLIRTVFPLDAACSEA